MKSLGALQKPSFVFQNNAKKKMPIGGTSFEFLTGV
ncbi:hypothetical protein DFP92_12531 [Yoonia sediminilitoris]|uniref:Uncharacterized protein n=1 Tax=Yoonia sediminilitoris TaxID=1286148 RepID=A0A2T6K5A3_9RHOB|nr:hypothetical protein C8N45_12531 [Yoonia sediminilitoris]RCW89590.1 hypothetical protein DFP92_12531 [Yoonia sediminilitoris]